MIRSTRLRPLLLGLAVLPLLCAVQRPAAALIEIEAVSKARAKELGITVTAKPRPDSGDMWVWVDFKTQGALKGFSSADLVVSKDGKRLVMAALMPRKPAVDSAAGEKRLDFYLEPSLLSEATITVIAYPGGRAGTGYQLKLKDFLPAAASGKR
jgi:hypothetical protein